MVAIASIICGYAAAGAATALGPLTSSFVGAAVGGATGGALTTALNGGNLGFNVITSVGLAMVAAGMYQGAFAAFAQISNAVATELLRSTLSGFVAGAATGAVGSAIYGGSPLKGALIGGLTGAAMAAAAYKIGQWAAGSPAVADSDGMTAGSAGKPGAKAIQDAATRIAEDATPAQRAVAQTIYGEAGGAPYEDKLGVGWTLRNRFEIGSGLTYEKIAEQWYAPRTTLRANNMFEFNAWRQSFQAAAEVLNASPGSSPIPGVTHFHDWSIAPPSWATGRGAREIPYGSGGLRFYQGVPW
jgi:hypothetical protein